jgi:hypothetical protein
MTSNTCRDPGVSEDVLDLVVRPQLSTAETGVECIFQRQPFREGRLSVVVERDGTESLRQEAWRSALCGTGIKHLVPG